MVCENFKHIDPDEFHGREITLHDCVANHISFENHALRFFLPDGIWITPHHEENSCGATVRSGAAEVIFSTKDIDEITVRVFSERTCCRRRKVRVEDWHMEQLIEAVNSGKCTWQFIAQYRSHDEQMWYCVIHSKKKPYYRECQLYLPETRATFFWSDLRPDRKW